MFLNNPEYSESKHLSKVDLKATLPLKVSDSRALTLAAIGVVFGDIGTSPLYALKACFNPIFGIALTNDSIFGIISMIFWALVFVVSLKYILFVMQANNQGEGGILALTALTIRTMKTGTNQSILFIIIGVFGACLFYGDAVITPAISVLSALEGLNTVSKGLTQFILPLTLIILFTLFYFEKKGTATVGYLFGPVMLVWFIVIGLMGLNQVLSFPQILLALNPLFAIKFMAQDPAITLAVAGSIFLVLTGAEALYADMGHFGSKPIKRAWFFLVMPCLLLNYFGQGAMLINRPDAISNPFFMMAPDFLLYCLVVLSTVATVIASQACISGAYSMTSQAMTLGFLPRMRIIFTSDKEIGQIYIPFINWLLCLIVMGIVLLFRKSESLASAYGFAVSTTMLMTTLLTAVVMRVLWKWNLFLVTLVIGIFIFIDMGFFISNLNKISQGGWLPLSIGCVSFLLMITWYQGRELLRRKLLNDGTDIQLYTSKLPSRKKQLTLVNGTAIFLTTHIDRVPNSFTLNVLHNKNLHKRIIFLKISSWDLPRVTDTERLTVKNIGNGIFLIRAIFGFKESADINHIIKLLSKHHNIDCTIEDLTYFLSNDSVIEGEVVNLSFGREQIFLALARNALHTQDFYNFDPSKVIKLGPLVDI